MLYYMTSRLEYCEIPIEINKIKHLQNIKYDLNYILFYFFV